MLELSDQLETYGFALVNDLIREKTLTEAISALAELNTEAQTNRRGGNAYGVRDLVSTVPRLGPLAEHPSIRTLVDALAGNEPQVVRSIYFDKTPEANWKVAWHQDLTIAVRERIDVDGFSAWSVKAGTPHVQPPAEILENTLTVRIHLDDTSAANGALKVIPGSHRHGRLDEPRMRQLIDAVEPAICNVPRGGALFMRPLLLHASSAGTDPVHRRVIHLEYSSQKLPGGLEWA